MLYGTGAYLQRAFISRSHNCHAKNTPVIMEQRTGSCAVAAAQPCTVELRALKHASLVVAAAWHKHPALGGLSSWVKLRQVILSKYLAALSPEKALSHSTTQKRQRLALSIPEIRKWPACTQMVMCRQWPGVLTRPTPGNILGARLRLA